MARTIPVWPPAPQTRYPLSNGAQARTFGLGPLPAEVMNGKVHLSPYAQFGPTPAAQRLGYKPVQPLKGPSGAPIVVESDPH